MTTPLIVGILALLVILAVLPGLVDRESRRRAWRRIAAGRRRNHEQQQWLRDAARQTTCANCPFRDDHFQLEDNWDGA